MLLVPEIACRVDENCGIRPARTASRCWPEDPLRPAPCFFPRLGKPILDKSVRKTTPFAAEFFARVVCGLRSSVLQDFCPPAGLGAFPLNSGQFCPKWKSFFHFQRCGSRCCRRQARSIPLPGETVAAMASTPPDPHAEPANKRNSEPARSVCGIPQNWPGDPSRFQLPR